MSNIQLLLAMPKFEWCSISGLRCNILKCAILALKQYK